MIFTNGRDETRSPTLMSRGLAEAGQGRLPNTNNQYSRDWGLVERRRNWVFGLSENSSHNCFIERLRRFDRVVKKRPLASTRSQRLDELPREDEGNHEISIVLVIDQP